MPFLPSTLHFPLPNLAFNKAVKKQEEKNGIVVDENNMVSIFLSADDSKDEASPTDEDKDEDGGDDAPADNVKDDAKEDDEMPAGDQVKDEESAQDKGKKAVLLLLRSFHLISASILTIAFHFSYELVHALCRW